MDNNILTAIISGAVAILVVVIKGFFDNYKDKTKDKASAKKDNAVAETEVIKGLRELCVTLQDMQTKQAGQIAELNKNLAESNKRLYKSEKKGAETNELVTLLVDVACVAEPPACAKKKMLPAKFDDSGISNMPELITFLRLKHNEKNVSGHTFQTACS